MEEDMKKYPRYMMATTAIHTLGDISRDEPDLCFIEQEERCHYIGQWATGFGFIDVHFPKSTTRDLTPEEVNHYNKKSVAHSNGLVHKLNVTPPADNE